MTATGRAITLVSLLSLAACGGGWNGSVQCAPYAREHSAIDLRGNAYSWWKQSEGKYAHTHQPKPGAVLVFRSTSRLPAGHVSIVREVRGPRAVLVDQANWNPGRIDHRVPVVDVSRNNDWSRVRVWWSPSDSMGKSVYPTYGFILPVSPWAWSS